MANRIASCACTHRVRLLQRTGQEHTSTCDNGNIPSSGDEYSRLWYRAAPVASARRLTSHRPLSRPAHRPSANVRSCTLRKTRSSPLARGRNNPASSPQQRPKRLSVPQDALRPIDTQWSLFGSVWMLSRDEWSALEILCRGVGGFSSTAVSQQLLTVCLHTQRRPVSPSPQLSSALLSSPSLGSPSLGRLALDSLLLRLDDGREVFVTVARVDRLLHRSVGRVGYRQCEPVGLAH